MSIYGENDKQGQYWNEAPGQSWVVNDTAMNERLQIISDILFEGLDPNGSILDWILVAVQVQQQDV